MQEIVKSLGLSKLVGLPMPSLQGRNIVEPSEIDMHRMMAYAREGELYKVPKQHVDWICYRLMPSLMRYGCYPPPHEAPAANDSQV